MDRRSLLRLALLAPMTTALTACAGWEKDYIEGADDERERRKRRREVERVEERFEQIGGDGGGY